MAARSDVRFAEPHELPLDPSNARKLLNLREHGSDRGSRAGRESSKRVHDGESRSLLFESRFSSGMAMPRRLFALWIRSAPGDPVLFAFRNRPRSAINGLKTRRDAW